MPLPCPGAPRAPALTLALALALALTLAVLLAAFSPAARAEMGACVPDRFDGLVCGSGTGAARVVDGSVSLDKRFAFAWRDPAGAIESEPGGDLELVMVRLADGAVLATRPTGYWATGEMRVNRLHEDIVWSPDSRLAVRIFQGRFESGHFDVFASTGGSAQVVDLYKLVAPALNARLSGRERRTHAWSLAVEKHKLTIGNSGRVRFNAMLWVPKDGPQVHFHVTLQVTRATRGLAAQFVSVRRGRTAE